MPRLEVQNVVMQFNAVLALNGVSLTFEPGEVHGIVGENGAGKSTLMKIVSGVQSPTSGAITLDGKPYRPVNVREALASGIAMIHQELNLVDELSVADNVFLGRELTRLGALDRVTMLKETENYLQQVNASFPAATKVGQLSIAGKQLVEIAKAVAVDASILVMDEPTAVLSEPEAEALFKLIARLKERGVTIIYCSHRLPEICAICDRISVMRDGSLIDTLQADVASPRDLADLMVGRALADFFPPKVPAPTGAPILEVRGVTVRGRVQDASFSVRPGEILGLAGLVGAGRTELAEAVVGARSRIGGEVLVEGSARRIRSPKHALRNRIAYVSEDRKGLGLLTSLSGTHNVTMANLKRYGTALLNRKKEAEAAKAWKDRLSIRVDLDGPISNASGGNQQKVSVAKWLDAQPRVMLLDEPTRGIDVGAKREMYDLIQRLAGEGVAFLVISSELPEIIGLCHRAIVMREGCIVGEVSGDELSEEALIRLAAGVTTT